MILSIKNCPVVYDMCIHVHKQTSHVMQPSDIDIVHGQQFERKQILTEIDRLCTNLPNPHGSSH